MALALAGLAATATYRISTANEIRNLSADTTYRRIEKHLPRESVVYMLDVQWLYNDPLMAFGRVNGREFVRLSDTTSRLPAKGMLVTSRRMPHLTSADSIVNKTFVDLGPLYVYSLEDGHR